eukprot:scaffold285_cov330-Pavlova_lutheri.AAC.77
MATMMTWEATRVASMPGRRATLGGSRKVTRGRKAVVTRAEGLVRGRTRERTGLGGRKGLTVVMDAGAEDERRRARSGHHGARPTARDRFLRHLVRTLPAAQQRARESGRRTGRRRSYRQSRHRRRKRNCQPAANPRTSDDGVRQHGCQQASATNGGPPPCRNHQGDHPQRAVSSHSAPLRTVKRKAPVHEWTPCSWDSMFGIPGSM